MYNHGSAVCVSDHMYARVRVTPAMSLFYYYLPICRPSLHICRTETAAQPQQDNLPLPLTNLPSDKGSGERAEINKKKERKKSKQAKPIYAFEFTSSRLDS